MAQAGWLSMVGPIIHTGLYLHYLGICLTIKVQLEYFTLIRGLLFVYFFEIIIFLSIVNKHVICYVVSSNLRFNQQT